MFDLVFRACFDLGVLIFIVLQVVFIIATIKIVKGKGKKTIRIVRELEDKKILEDYNNLNYLYINLLSDLNNDNEVKYQLGLISLSSYLNMLEKILDIKNGEKDCKIFVSKGIKDKIYNFYNKKENKQVRG